MSEQTAPVDPSQMLNSPALTTAQQGYSTAQTQANTSAEQDLTLPQMLLSSFSSNMAGNNPIVQQQGQDETNYQNTLGAAPTASPYTTFNGQQIAVSPSTFMGGMTAKEQEAATPLNAANMQLALENQGVLNETSMLASKHAQETQQLTDQAQVAQQNVNNILQQLSTKANLALGYDQVNTQMKQLKEQEHEFSQSPTQLALQTSPVMEAQAKTTSDFASFYQMQMSNPAFVTGQGTQANAAQALFNAWTQYHNASDIDSGTMKKLLDMGINTGNILAQPENITSQLAAPASEALQGLGKAFSSMPGAKLIESGVGDFLPTSAGGTLADLLGFL